MQNNIESGQTIQILTPELNRSGVKKGEILKITHKSLHHFETVSEDTGQIWAFQYKQLNEGFKIMTTNDKPTGIKHDNEKPPMELLSSIAMIATAKVMGVGAKKYSPNNWRGGMSWTRLIGACQRHLAAFMAGEDLDPETGLPHLDHLACEVMFLQEFYRTKKHLDDRYNTAEAIKDLMPITAQSGVSQKTE